jgi:hypothetical protein
MMVKEAGDPLGRSTQRQLLVGIAVLSALGVWRLDGKKESRKNEVTRTGYLIRTPALLGGRAFGVAAASRAESASSAPRP